eukprot:jgi/Mesvir1/23033/Mv03026-RA.1
MSRSTVAAKRQDNPHGKSYAVKTAGCKELMHVCNHRHVLDVKGFGLVTPRGLSAGTYSPEVVEAYQQHLQDTAAKLRLKDATLPDLSSAFEVGQLVMFHKESSPSGKRGTMQGPGAITKLDWPLRVIDIEWNDRVYRVPWASVAGYKQGDSMESELAANRALGWVVKDNAPVVASEVVPHGSLPGADTATPPPPLGPNMTPWMGGMRMGWV